MQIKTEIDKVAPLAERTRRARTKKSNPFYILPYHVRLQILDLVVKPILQPLFLRNCRNGALSHFPIPYIAEAFDHRFRLEGLLVLLEKSSLEIYSGPGLMKLRSFLHYVDFNEATPKDTSYDLGYDCIRALRFPFFSRFPHTTLPADAFNEDIMMMRACKNLTSVATSWMDDELTYFDNVDGYQPKSLERIRKEYRLDSILVLKKLKSFHLRSKMTCRVSLALGNEGFKQLVALRKWFVEEFEKRGRAVQITVS